MSLKRLQQFRKYLHFSDNTQSDLTDQYYKIRPIMEAVRQTSLFLEEVGECGVSGALPPSVGTSTISFALQNFWSIIDNNMK